MTARRPVFRPQADAEALQAQRWYEERTPGLGVDFAAAVTDAVARIVENPLAYARVRGEVRRAILQRFPFGVYFRVLPDEIIILAVSHGHRHPRSWQLRR